MKIFIICITMFLVGFLAACEKKNATSSTSQESISASKSLEIPKVDLSTPEKAIYSYQTIKNWENAYYWETNRTGPLFEQISKRNEEVASVALPLYQDRVVQIIKENKEIQKSGSARKYEFNIEEMKKETDTRVIAMVKVLNITPVSAGAEPNESVSKWRQEGKRFKIVLELENARWLISDISELEDYPKEWRSQISSLKQHADWIIKLP